MTTRTHTLPTPLDTGLACPRIDTVRIRAHPPSRCPQVPVTLIHRSQKRCLQLLKRHGPRNPQKHWTLREPLEPAYRRALHLCSQWDGDLDVLAASRVPVRMSTGANDDYYGSAPVSRTYAQLREKYLAAGLSQEEVDELVMLDVKPDEYFEGHTDFYGEHGGGLKLFPHDPEVMGWLFQ